MRIECVDASGSKVRWESVVTSPPFLISPLTCTTLRGNAYLRVVCLEMSREEEDGQSQLAAAGRRGRHAKPLSDSKFAIRSFRYGTRLAIDRVPNPQWHCFGGKVRLVRDEVHPELLTGNLDDVRDERRTQNTLNTP